MLSRDTFRLLKFDIVRFFVRFFSVFKVNRKIKSKKIHFGCGARKVNGWLNVDLLNSDWNVDLCSPLPWPKATFDVAVGQQVIEHLDVERSLIPFLSELNRVMSPGGVLWLSCPDMEKIAKAYLDDRGASILKSRMERYPPAWYGVLPPQQIVNELFVQGGEHKNLFDYDYLSFLLEKAGFKSCARKTEVDFLLENPGFPPRRDDDVSLYVRCLR